MGTLMTVFILQCQATKDLQTGEFVDKYDFSSAEEYGTLKFLLSPTANPFNVNESGVVAQLHGHLKDFNDNDYLLLVGNPCLIGIAAAIAADYSGGGINFLQWSGKKQSYIPIYAHVFDC
jgi:hypothetical protein